MKRYDNLYARICSLDNLLLADTRARRGKGGRYGVRVFDRDRLGNLLRLRESLLAGTFRTTPYSVFTIHDPKEREIYRLPYYPDRIVHHAVMNILEPIWVRTFISETYACVKGRGIQGAEDGVQAALKSDPDGTRYCLKLDIRHFYPSIDHGTLKAIIRRKIKDGRLLALLDGIIDSAPGVPIGNYLSQYFANLYLTPFDHWLKEVKGVRYYFRYADDMVIFGADKAALHALLRGMRVELREGYGLEVKGNWQVFPTDARGVDFVGFVFRHGYTRLRKGIKRSACRRAAKCRALEGLKEKKQALASYIGWVRHCDGRNLSYKLNSMCYGQIF